MCADTPLCGETAHEWDLAALVLRGRPPAVDAADPARACWALDASAHHTLALAAEPHARRLVLRVRRTGPPAREQRATVGLGAVAALARHAGGVLRVALRRDTARSPDVWALTAGALDTCDEIRACLAARADAAPAAALLARVCGLPPCPHIVSEDDDDEETDVLRLPGACVRVIPYADLDFGAPRKIIGGGFHAVVYRARYCGEDVAVKVFKAGSTGGVDRDRFCREVAMLVRARHPSVVLCYGVCVEPLGIVTQFVPHDDRGSVANLRTWLHSAAPGLRAITATAARLAHTLQFLHRQSPPVLHRDLRSVNVLIDTTGRPILADFTLSCLADAAGTATAPAASASPTGPADEFYEVSAPEVLAGAPYTVRSEIWSFGLMLWELFVRQPPQTWHHEPLLAQLRTCCPSPAMLALISRCLDADPAARPSLNDIIATLATVLAALDSSSSSSSSPRSSSSPQPQQLPLSGTTTTTLAAAATAAASTSPPLLRPRCAQDAVAADTTRRPRKYARLCDIARALAATTSPDPAPGTHGP